MYDRLAELRSSSSSSFSSTPSTTNNDLEAPLLYNEKPSTKKNKKKNKNEMRDIPGSPRDTGASKDGEQSILNEFFAQVDEVKMDIEFIQSTSQEIMRIKDDSFRSSGGSKKKLTSNTSLAKMVSHTNVISKTVKESIQLMRQELGKDNNKNSRTLQVRTNVLNALTRKFILVMKGYQAAQEDYRVKANATARRQVKIIQPEATEQEVDHLLKHANSSDLTTMTILKKSGKNTANSSITDAFSRINDKYSDVLLLEASITELARMFEEFALMVEEQSELLDNIEFQVLSTKDFIEDGLDESRKAIKLQKKLRKKRCCIILFCMVVGFLFLLMKVNLQ